MKARLSEYLRDVRRGEVFLVTDRDEVVAELRPATTASLPARDELEQALDGLAQAGEVQPPRASREGWSWQPKGAGLPTGTAARVLDELRADRDERP